MPEKEIDYLDIFRSPPNKNLKISAVVALILHLILFLIVFPSLSRRVFIPEQMIVLRPLASPPEGLTKTSPQEDRKEKIVVKKPKKAVVPIPDPTPQEPEIIKKPEEEITPIIPEITEDIDIGGIKGPPAEGSGKGDKEGPGKGSGQGEPTGTGMSGPYKVGDAGVTSPVPLEIILPSYTNEAIKAKIKGSVFLEAVILPNGSIDSGIKLIQGLGYGLDEKAMEYVFKWKFRPGTKDGKPVPVLVTIEMEFTLR